MDAPCLMFGSLFFITGLGMLGATVYVASHFGESYHDKELDLWREYNWCDIAYHAVMAVALIALGVLFLSHV